MFKKVLLVAISLVALSLGILLSTSNISFNSDSNAEEIEGFFWPEQKALSEFKMVSHHNTDFTEADLKGKWSIIFFGYTHCPDICPLTMNTLREVKTLLAETSYNSKDDTQFVFISVDGVRDTPDHLANYIQFYNPEFIAASGTKEEVDSLTTQLGVPYSIDEPDEGESHYNVNHSGALFLINDQYRLAALFNAPLDAADIVSKYDQIRQVSKNASG